MGYLGAGAWGFCLACLLAKKGHKILSWTKDRELAKKLSDFHEHPSLPGQAAHENMRFTTDLKEALEGADLVVEAVTSKGVRHVFEAVGKIAKLKCPIVLTSKGIEQNTGLILPEVVLDVLGPDSKEWLALLSGPSFAAEVIRGLPTSVVASAWNKDVMDFVSDTFTTETFRVYPNQDILGVAYGGALKNIIAIACGISEGLGLGFSSKAALLTRGLHEMIKLAVARGCSPETLRGLAGLGDVCLTSSSLLSRNFRFGHLLAQGFKPQEVEKMIGGVVEGTYTAVSALQLSSQLGVDMPITEIVWRIIYENMQPEKAVKILMQRSVKEEHL